MPIIVNRKRRIFFTIEGERGPYLLLLHGLLGSQRDWYDWGFVARLAPDFRLILPDALGHGGSDKPLVPEDYQLGLLGEDMVELLNHLDVRNATLVGSSLGALVGFHLASRFPERVRGAFLGGEAPYPTEDFLDLCRAGASRLRQGSLAELLRQGREQGWVQTARREVDEDQLEPARLMLEAIGNWEAEKTNKFSLRGPVLLFSGVADPAYGRLQKARNITARSRLISLDDVTTAQALGEPGALISELTAFVSSLRAGQAGQQEKTGRGGAPGGGENRSRKEPSAPGAGAGAPDREQPAQAATGEGSAGPAAAGREEAQSEGRAETGPNGRPEPAAPAPPDGPGEPTEQAEAPDTGPEDEQKAAGEETGENHSQKSPGGEGEVAEEETGENDSEKGPGGEGEAAGEETGAKAGGGDTGEEE